MIERHEIYFDEKNSRAYKCLVLEKGYLGMFITIETAAAMLKVTRQGIEHHIKNGTVKYYTTHDGRVIVALADIEKLQNHKPKPGRKPKKEAHHD